MYGYFDGKIMITALLVTKSSRKDNFLFPGKLSSPLKRRMDGR